MEAPRHSQLERHEQDEELQRDFQKAFSVFFLLHPFTLALPATFFSALSRHFSSQLQKRFVGFFFLPHFISSSPTPRGKSSERG